MKNYISIIFILSAFIIGPVGEMKAQLPDDPGAGNDIGTHNKPFGFVQDVVTYGANTGRNGSPVDYSFTIQKTMNIIIHNYNSQLYNTRISASIPYQFAGVNNGYISQVRSFLGETLYNSLYNGYVSGQDFQIFYNVPPGTYSFSCYGTTGVTGGTVNGRIRTTVIGYEGSAYPLPGYVEGYPLDLGYSSGVKTVSLNLDNFKFSSDTKKEFFVSFTLTERRNLIATQTYSSTEKKEDLTINLYNNQGILIAEQNAGDSYLSYENLKKEKYCVAFGQKFLSSPTFTLDLPSVEELPLSVAFSKEQNFVHTRRYTNIDGDKYTDNIQYFDGFGRPSQNIQRKMTPQLNDLISIQEYDNFGRDSHNWLPVPVKDNNGAFVDPATIKNTAKGSSIHNDQAPYNKAVYESTLLNRMAEQYGPGQDWHSNGKAVKTKYLTNNDAYPCIRFAIGTNAITNKGNYINGELYVTEIKDEDGNLSYEFKDKLGQVILTRQMSGSVKHDTYYVYDGWGNLRYVLPPMAVDNLSSGLGDESAMMKQYAYVYKYDNRNRCIKKRIPGCDWICYIYDKADRLILSRDGEQKSKGEWMFSIPDALGRTVITGICKNSISDAQLTTYLQNVTVKAVWAGITNAYRGYNISGITLTTPGILSVNYYDSYEFMGLNNIPVSTNVNVKYEVAYGYGTQYTGGYKGLLTGTLTAQQLSDGGIDPAYLYSVMYYDDWDRVVQTKSFNHMGGYEKEYAAYDFVGNPTKKKHVHSATGKTIQTEEYTYTYDHAGRPTKTTHRLNGGTTVTLAENTYDEQGRLKTNQKHTHANLKTAYAYNVRSWTKSITNPLFNQTLYYNESYGGSAKLYNGNISAMDWKLSSENITRGYAFTYDNLSRLAAASYLQNGAANNNYKTAYTYDKHGNMKTMQRYGKTTATAYGLIDNLTMNYNGNQLLNANDAVGTIALSESADFKNYSNTATEYTYNANGALSKDLNKGISGIQYNSLNLPRMMDIKSSVAEARNEYTYTADGQKLKVVQKWNPNFNTSPVIGSAINVSSLTKNKTTDYVGNNIYEDGLIKRILVDGGYIEGNVYHFYITDHLGNNRVVANATGTVIQKNHYYPFGTAFAETSTAEQGKQPYKYNNKELDQSHGLNWYDYEARHKDDWRFTTVDPLAEKYYSWSPYVYCMNNPLKYIDPTGMSPFPDDGGFWDDFFEALNQVGQQFLSTIGLSNNQLQSNNPIVLEDAGQRRQITLAVANVPKEAATEATKNAFSMTGLGTAVSIGTDAAEGNYMAMGLTTAGVAVDVATGGAKSVASKGRNVVNEVIFLTKNDAKMLKFAKETFKGNPGLSKEASNLVNQAAYGNLNPGKGTKALEGFNGIYELRGSTHGARVYFRQTNNKIEILGYSHKKNQQQVIDHLKAIYE